MDKRCVEILDYRMGHKVKLYKSNIKRFIHQGRYTIVYTTKGIKYMFLTDDFKKLAIK